MKGVALLVVDMQEVVLRLIPNAEDCIGRTAFAVEAASLLDMKILYTEQVPEKLGLTYATLLDAGLKKASRFPKKTFSAFGAAGLPEFLLEDGIEHLIVAGVETPVCLYQTVLSALQEELDITILSDCTAARREADHRVIFEAFEAMGCQCLPSETVFYSIIASAEHPQFRPFTQLVKNYS